MSMPRAHPGPLPDRGGEGEAPGGLEQWVFRRTAEPQKRQKKSTEANKDNEGFSPWFPSFASVQTAFIYGFRLCYATTR
jgi:hypothetical protein